MKDYLGNELKIGDEVIYIPYNERFFREAKIVGFSQTGTTVYLEKKDTYYKSLKQFSSQLIKIPTKQ